MRGTVQLGSRQPADVVLAIQMGHHLVKKLHRWGCIPRSVLRRDRYPQAPARTEQPSGMNGRVQAYPHLLGGHAKNLGGLGRRDGGAAVREEPVREFGCLGHGTSLVANVTQIVTFDIHKVKPP